MNLLRSFLRGLCLVFLVHLEFALSSESPELVGVPDAGIGALHPISCDRTTVGGICRSSSDTGDQEVEQELVASLETDGHVTGES